MANEEWGPLAGLIGEWRGEGGLDSAYSHAREEVVETPYLEKVTMKPFGPVATGEVMRCFVVPRGITTFAGGTATADATSFVLRADRGAELYNIGENQYLRAHASTVSYEATITICDGEWSYDELTTLQMKEFPDPFPHTDHNTLRRA